MKKYLFLVLASVLFAGCQDALKTPQKGERVHNFTFEVVDYDPGESSVSPDTLTDTTARVSGRAGQGEITYLVGGIYDSRGMLLHDLITTQTPDFAQMSVEGLLDGDYTAVFIGLGEQRSAQRPSIVLPEQLDQPWIEAQAAGFAQNNEYLYARCPFTIRNNEGLNIDVGLKRAVGRIDIEPIFTDKHWTKGSIKSILISMDDGSVYTTQSAQGTYQGQGGILPTEIADHFNLYSLPTIGTQKRHGSLAITGLRGDATPYRVVYDFELIVEPNQRAVICPSYEISGDKFGTVRVYDADRNASNSLLMLQDPTDGTHHYKQVASHVFKVNGLLKLTFDNQTLTAQFYSHIGVKDVMVYARRANDAEYFEVAWFESVKALEQRTIALSRSPHNRLYRTISGGTVFIDRMTNDLQYKYVSSDDHMQKLAFIEWPCRLSFIQPTADTTRNTSDKLPFRAVHAREAIALWTNLGYVYTHPMWQKVMLEKEAKKPFLEDGKPVSLKDVFIPQVFNKASNNFAVLNVLNAFGWETTGYASVGSGDFLGMRQKRVYIRHYMNQDDGWQTYMVGPHEYGHTLGYGHEGDFTYGQCTNVNVECFKALAKELPYPSSKLLNSEQSPHLYPGLD